MKFYDEENYKSYFTSFIVWGFVAGLALFCLYQIGSDIIEIYTKK